MTVWFPQTGEVAARMRELDWSKTSIGDPSTWPAALHSTIRLMLASRYSMWMGWGPELTFFYNDAYREETLAAKHPWALGRPASEVWAEIWEAIGPRIQHVLETGQATWDEGLLLFLERSGYREETYHTFSYSPAYDDTGKIAGLFCVVIEETDRVIGERRISILRDLAAAIATTKTQPEVLAALERVITDAARKMTFSITYLADEDDGLLHRAAITAIDPRHPRAPLTIDASSADDSWKLADIVAMNQPLVIALDANDAWPEATLGTSSSHALVVPIHLPGRAGASGAFIAGLSPFRKLDDGVMSFFELFVGQLAAGLGNALAYEEAEERADALAKLDRAKTAFFSNVSHELRTPLTLMLGPTADALASPEGALRGAELEMVHRNELRLLKLVNTLLDFARIEAGRTKAHYQATDLAVLTTDLASAFRSTMERGGLRLEVDVSSLGEDAYVDRDMWEKIVLNLLSNAFKFTFEGSVRVSLARRDRRVVLQVADSGVGIAPEDLPRVFDRFHRIEGMKSRTHEGTGIGLALVRDLVGLHGGEIDVASELGKGTTFTVTVPLGHEHLPSQHVAPGAQGDGGDGTRVHSFVTEASRWLRADDAPPSTATVPEANGSNGRQRILVADDNADMRDYVARLLREHWDVETVADGVEALEAARREAPALVLSDVMMPRLDGFGLVKQLRADASTASIPILLLSARAGEEETAVGLRTGADDYLVKPFSAGTLMARVESLLSRARFREELRRSVEDARTRVLAGLMDGPAAIAVLRGPRYIVEVFNPAAYSIVGLREDVIGRPIFEVRPDLREQGFEELMKTVVRTGKSHRAEAAPLHTTEDGRKREKYIDFVFAPLSQDDDGESRVLAWGFEVTALVVARRAAEEARAAAEVANRAKDEFVATMSHELRTPLNAILGWASLLRRDSDDPSRRSRALETIERNARAQSRLIDDVLEVSRIITGKLRIDTRRVRVATIIAAAVDVVRHSAEAKGITLTSDVADDVGEMVADPDRLQQIVWNLLSNAVKFTPQNGRIGVAVTRSQSHVRVVVTDNGMGIAPEHLPFVFDRFRQVDSSTTRRFGGLGLGLAIVRHLTEMHGGRASASSDGEGKGSAFTVVLPILAVAPRGADETATERPAASGPPAGSGADEVLLVGTSVLVVDDDEDSRVVITATLEGAGAKVTAVASVKAALAALEGARFDLLLSDIGMPGQDGYELVKRVRAMPDRRTATIPAIALTAYARPEDASLARAAGYERHIAKPVDPEVVIELVAKATGNVRG